MESETGRIFPRVTLTDLAAIRGYVRDTAVSGGCKPSMIAEFVVAVNEATANIVRHGYRDAAGDIEVTVVCRSEAVIVVLCDQCPPFDPTQVAAPDTTLPLAERPFGGLGVHMMRAYCDELRYRPLPRGGNELTLLKRLS